MKKKLLIIGNGSTGIDNQGNSFINKHTGNFLVELSKDFDVTFFQNTIHHEKDRDLSSFNLKNSKINYIKAAKTLKVNLLRQIFKLVTNFDLVYIFFPGTLSRITAIFCILTGKKFGVYLRGEKIDEYFFDKMIINRAKFILAVSPFFVQKLSRLNKNVEVIKPMIDITEKDFFADSKSINRDKVKILTVGRVEKRKGIYEFLELAQLIKNSDSNIHIDIVGGGEIIEEINKEINHKDLQNIIKLHGQISEKSLLKVFYLNADLFLFLSHDEGFPRVLYEAMAYKLPIFTTFVGGIPGRMIHNVNCIEVSLKSSKNVFDQIIEELQDYDKLKNLAVNGQLELSKIIASRSNTHQKLLTKHFRK